MILTLYPWRNATLLYNKNLFKIESYITYIILNRLSLFSLVLFAYMIKALFRQAKHNFISIGILKFLQYFFVTSRIFRRFSCPIINWFKNTIKHFINGAIVIKCYEIEILCNSDYWTVHSTILVHMSSEHRFNHHPTHKVFPISQVRKAMINRKRGTMPFMVICAILILL